MKCKVSVIILTYNEEIHIERAVKNVISWADEVVVLDSYSKDSTCNIARKEGAKVFQRKFDDYARQRNYAIKELPLNNDWVLFLDADEYLSEKLKVEITESVISEQINGFYISYDFVFLGRKIRYGGYGKTFIMRLFKKGQASISRAMNEHVIVQGKVSKLKNKFIHEDLKGLSFWSKKHIDYAEREMKQLLNNDGCENASFFGSQAMRKRWFRYKFWNKLPPLLRPFAYFLFRYFVRFGVLDGKVGFIFHFLHAFWYTILIDSLYLEKLIKKSN